MDGYILNLFLILFTQRSIGISFLNPVTYNPVFTYGALTNWWAAISVVDYASTSSLPFFQLYTGLTGSGDAGTFYHTRQTYFIPTPTSSATYVYYYGTNPTTDPRFPFLGLTAIPVIPVTSSSLYGTGDSFGFINPTETVTALVIQTDSAALTVHLTAYGAGTTFSYSGGVSQTHDLTFHTV